MKYVMLVSALLGMVGFRPVCASDLIEVTRSTNRLVSLSLRRIECRSGSNAPQPQAISLSLDLPPARTQTDSWFSRPAGALSSPGVEWAERINGQAVRRQREAWEKAQKTGRLAPIPPLYPSRVWQILDTTK